MRLSKSITPMPLSCLLTFKASVAIFIPSVSIILLLSFRHSCRGYCAWSSSGIEAWVELIRTLAPLVLISIAWESISGPRFTPWMRGMNADGNCCKN